MNDFYNVEYMSERVAAIAKERDYYKREVAGLKEICEKQMRMNRSAAVTAVELDRVKAELDRAVELIHKWEKHSTILRFNGFTPPEKWEGRDG